MSTSTLVGRKVKILANDFVDIDVSGSVSCADDGGGKLLINLDDPISLSGVIYSHMVAAPRLEKDGFENLVDDKIIGCSMTWIPSTRFNPNDPFDLSWWRGGAVAISDLALV